MASESVGADASRRVPGEAHRVQSVLLGIDQGAALVGPAAGGFLLQWAGPGGMLAAVGGLSLLAALIAVRAPRTAPRVVASAGKGLRVGWSTLWSLPALVRLVTGLVLSNLALGVLEAAVPVLLVERLDRPTSSVRIVWSAAAAVSLTTIALSRYAITRWGLRAVGRLAALVTAGSFFALAGADSYPAYLVLVAVFMAADGVLAVVLRTLRSRLIPAHVFGSTLSVTVMILRLPYPLAGALVAVTAPAGLGRVIVVCGVLQCLGLVLAFVRPGRRGRHGRGRHRRALEPAGR
ncbi:MFS transporter [Streptomyces minutiscleroticus]|uniref:MFS transporter n=1 Tax=Streptomyces minutiscleroticus TaxID=68238 RepID=UPI0033293556